MDELVTREQADVFFAVLLLAGIASAPVAAWASRRRGGRPVPAALAVGGPPILLGILWRVYNSVTDRLGLDTVLNLAVNLALFAVVGVLCGVLWAFVRTAEPSPAAAVPGAMAESGGDLGGVADAPDGE